MFEGLRQNIANFGIFAKRFTTDIRWPGAPRIPYTGRTLAAIRMTPDTAVTIPAVWACLRYLSQTVAVLPWHVMRDGDDGAEIADTHGLDYMLWKRVSKEWSSFQFRETLTHWALRWGNGYAEIEPDQAGRPFALWPIHPERVYVLRSTDDTVDAYGETILKGELYYEVGQGSSGGSEGAICLSQKRMFHVRGFGEGPVGVNVIGYAAESLGWAKAAQLFGASFFGNGANLSTVVLNKRPLKPEGLRRQRAEFDQLYTGPRNAHKTAFLDADADVKTFGLDAEKSQLNQTNQALVADVCFVSGTKIITPRGFKVIEQIEVGDRVLTHRGRWRRVTNVMRRSYVGSTVTSSAKGLQPVISTANHPFYVQKVKATRTHRVEPCGRPDWIAADSLNPIRRQSDGRRARGEFDSLIVPRLDHDARAATLDMSKWAAPGFVNNGAEIFTSGNPAATPITRQIEVGYDLGWLCGLFAADGSASDHQVVFYIGAHEKEVTSALVARLGRVFGARVSTARVGNVDRTTVSHKILAAFFSDFGHIAHEKSLADWCMAGSEDHRRGLIDGLVAGDGCVYRGRSMLRTTSETLSWQTRILLWSIGTNTTLQTQAEGLWEINGRSGVSREMMTVEWRHEQNRRGTMGKAIDAVFFQLEQATQSTFSGTVYNLEVEEDESYTTVGGCVHNCRWFGVPPHKVMDLTRATFSNIEHQAIEVVVDSVSPWVKRFEDEADYKLFGAQNRQGFYTRMNMRGLMRGDFAARVSYYDGMVKIGAYSPNRVLELEDENTIGTAGDIHVMQNQNVTLEQIANGAVATADPNEPAPPPVDSPAARIASLQLEEILGTPTPCLNAVL